MFFYYALCGTFYFESLMDKVFLKNIVSEERRVKAQVSEGSGAWAEAMF